MVERADILIVGAGAAGLTCGVALAQAGFKTIVAGPLDLRRNGRTVALFEASLRLYRALGLGSRLAPAAQPIRRIRIVDDTGSVFATPPLELKPGRSALKRSAPTSRTPRWSETLAEAARATPRLRLVEALVSDMAVRADGITARVGAERVAASLLIGADGRLSAVRATAGVATRAWSYPQSAITALVAHEKPHRATSTEFHTRAGPCTLVPMRGAGEGAHRSSLVWLMTPDVAHRRMEAADAALAAELEAQVHGVLGAMAFDGPRGAFPMTGLRCASLVGERVALVADAGHYFPPIGAQGLNLGLRDVGQLVDSLGTPGGDPGAARGLAAYDAARRLDVDTRAWGVDLLNRSLLVHAAPMDFIRAAGLAAMSAIGPLRRRMLWEGLAPRGRLPKLMRAPA